MIDVMSFLGVNDYKLKSLFFLQHNVVLNVIAFSGIIYNLVTLFFIPELNNLIISDEKIQINEKKNIKWADVIRITYIKEDLNFENGPLKIYLKTENQKIFKKLFHSKICIDTNKYNLRMMEIIQIAKSKNIEVNRADGI